ncbi:MAG: nucleotide exchange factor GrpE, partial [Sulfurimonas sp.]|nr:nucleotide exchange factor GrpE [Sulfurimonas sp.]
PQEHLEKLKEGIELTLKQLTTSLEKHGVTIVSHDEPFDPNIHNAVQSVDSDTVQSGQIVQTFQTGYRYKERPLREAMVVVAN